MVASLPTNTRRFAVWLTVIAVCGLALRLAYLRAVRHDWIGGDGFAYSIYARNLDAGNGFIEPLSRIARPDAVHPPAWALVLTVPRLFGFESQWAGQVWSALIGSGSVIVVGLAGRRIAGSRAGLIAAGIAALYPGFWMYERELLSETLLLLVVGLAILAAYRFIEQPSIASAVLLGTACGMLALTRGEQSLAVLFLFVPTVLFAARTLAVRRRLGMLAAGGLSVALVIAPWAVYNLGRFDHPVVLSSHLGPTLVVGNCDEVYSGPTIGYFDKRCALRASKRHRAEIDDQSDRDLVFRKEALAYTRDHLSRLPLVILAREGRAWSVFAPFQTARLDAEWSNTRPWVHLAELPFFWVLSPFAAGGVVVLRRRQVPVYPLLAFVAVVVVAVALTFGQTRYRAAAQVPIVLLAAIAIDAAMRPMDRRRPAESERADVRETLTV